MKEIIQNIEIELVKADIPNQPDVEVVVNAANDELAIGGGVARAIHGAAGPALYQECQPIAPIAPGKAVITGAYNLPNKRVVHSLGPAHGRDKPEDKLLGNCYKSALKRAEENKVKSVAFPATSTGAFGYRIKEATKITFKTILAEIPELKHRQKLKFVLFSEADLEIYEAMLAEV